MHIKKCKRRGHIYYAVVHSMLREDKVVQDYLLNLGRLDTLTESKRKELEQKNSGLDVSIEEAMKTLERLKAVHIVVGKDEGIQVHRKLSGLNKKARTLIEVFGMANNKILPEVDTKKFK